jgi:hypothetical protein
MKIIFAALVVALTSFATENISETAIDFETSSSLSTLADSNIVEGQIVEGCETSTIRWASGESDGHGGMVLKFHHATLVTCDDGFAAIVD